MKMSAQHQVPGALLPGKAAEMTEYEADCISEQSGFSQRRQKFLASAVINTRFFHAVTTFLLMRAITLVMLAPDGCSLCSTSACGHH